ncbi:putative DD41D transposase [Trichonephila clavipes]|nr:putative DD41D transposase [Trichonephila clavipes]
MFDSSKPDDNVVNFVSKLKSHMQSLHPKPPKHHGKRPVFIHPGLLEATHVFLRRDMLRRPLQQPYDGPFKVLQRKDKVFFLDINGRQVSVSIDRCKPAFFLNTEDLQLPQTKNETPATVESDPTASTPTQPSTRSGRKVHLPTSDEAHFWLNGYVNKQNCRIWSEANPQVYVETPLHPEKLTVWCALWAGGIIGPYFFKNDEGHNVTVNGDRYRAMITNFLFLN